MTALEVVLKFRQLRKQRLFLKPNECYLCGCFETGYPINSKSNNTNNSDNISRVMSVYDDGKVTTILPILIQAGCLYIVKRDPCQRHDCVKMSWLEYPQKYKQNYSLTGTYILYSSFTATF